MQGAICFFFPLSRFSAKPGKRVEKAPRNTCFPQPAVILCWCFQLAMCFGVLVPFLSMFLSMSNPSCSSPARHKFWRFWVWRFQSRAEAHGNDSQGSSYKNNYIAGGKSGMECPQKRSQRRLQDLSQLCVRARCDLRGSFITATCNCRKYAPKKHRRKECEGRLHTRSVSISPFVLMRMLWKLGLLFRAERREDD